MKDFYIVLLIFICKNKLQLYGMPTKPETLKGTTSNPLVPVNQNTSAYDHFIRCSPTQRVKMIATCPSEYTNDETIRKCEKGFALSSDEDISVHIPVTGRQSRLHYANEYCAACHSDSSTEHWAMAISCPLMVSSEANETSSKAELLSKMVFDKTSKEFAATFGDETTSCTFWSVKPDMYAAVSCSPSVISECPSDVAGPRHCSRFTGGKACHSRGFEFLNADCARCNNVPSKAMVPCIGLQSYAVETIFELRKTSNGGGSCAIPSIALHYCAKLH